METILTGALLVIVFGGILVLIPLILLLGAYAWSTLFGEIKKQRAPK